ncbi:MAG: 1-(5-phosphoribosyl)-5-[(5-phosphoribosylamino)methylideneamino]imidazole-4-carboxamide isomerase [Puniceicoccales bacterium]
MIIYPAIDIKHGACVRLVQGVAEMETLYHEDPIEPAKEFKAAGADWIHVVDLDGAFSGEMKNLEAVKRIAALGLKIQLGGGIRSAENIETALAAGASRVVVGTRACQDKDFVVEMARKFGSQVAVGIDARESKVAVKGWVETTDTPAVALAQSVAEVGIETIIYTDISTDGLMRGPNFEGMKQMWAAVPCQVIASGGVHDTHDVVHYKNLSARYPNLDGVIVGKAIYEGKVNLKNLLSIAAG